MAKVVALVGSPRKTGNVSTLVQEMLRGARERGAETQLFHLNELTIRGCQSCMHCRQHPACCLKDDMTAILEAIREADALILGSPIYIWQMSGQLKLALDRFYPLTDEHHKPRFGTKRVALVFTQAAPLAVFFRWYIHYTGRSLKDLGLRVKHTLISTMAFTPDASSKHPRVMRKAFRIGQALAG